MQALEPWQEELLERDMLRELAPASDPRRRPLHRVCLNLSDAATAFFYATAVARPMPRRPAHE